jgi:hypothetical protein
MMGRFRPRGFVTTLSFCLFSNLSSQLRALLCVLSKSAHFCPIGKEHPSLEGIWITMSQSGNSNLLIKEVDSYFTSRTISQ